MEAVTSKTTHATSPISPRLGALEHLPPVIAPGPGRADQHESRCSATIIIPALNEAQAKQCGEAIWFTTENRLAEGCISNIFLVKDDVLFTPPVDTPVLPGVTRAVVLSLAVEAGLAVREIFRPLIVALN